MAEDGDLVYVIPVGDGSGSWVLMNNEYEEVQECSIPKVSQALAQQQEMTEQPVVASKAPAAVGAAGLGLMLLAGLL
jgi:hypothetical protein